MQEYNLKEVMKTIVSFENERLILKGVDYLEENSVLGKSCNVVKELITWIK
ncbi:YjcQ family protein [Lysinibacillus endophyticus]|uniref:YjcQ family protein n=1 Tax=Ureibacillus endophyticus TaxID=1978490 RepID=UPI0031356149